IGTNAAGAFGLGNGVGVRIAGFFGISDDNNTIGGTAIGAGNVITGNTSTGIVVGVGIGNEIVGNSIFANGALGIDLGGGGVTLNDAGDADTGPNNLLNFPVLQTATFAAGNLTVTGFARPGSLIEFFAASPDPTGFGEGRAFVARFTEGSAADTDATTGTYGPGNVNGLNQGTDTTNRFSFTF